MGVQLPEKEDVDYTDLQLVYYVKDTLKSAHLDKSDSYLELIGVLHHTERLTPDEVAMLVTSLKALSGAVNYINADQHQLLLSAISGMSLWNYGPIVMDALVELIVSLAAGKYLDLCLVILVQNFMPPLSFLKLLQQPRGLAKKDQVLSCVHSAVEKITDVMPLAPLIWVNLIKERMPHRYTKQPWILSVIYVENMLRLNSGALGDLVGQSMLVELMNRIVDIDAEIEWDELLIGKGMFEKELEEQDTSAAAEMGSTEISKDSSNQKILPKNEAAEHMDLLMVFIFEHLKSCYESDRLKRVFEDLHFSFQKIVLTANNLKFSQFVMFYACSLYPEACGEEFADRLVETFKNSGEFAELRIKAVAYLGSYLSRAKFVSASYVTTVLESLVNWCCTYCKSQEGETNPKAHTVFYAGIQVVMYVLCFRMRSMLAVPRLKSQLFLMPIRAILKHSLNPLKVCLPLIVHEFLQQAKAVQLFNVSEVYGGLESEFSRDCIGVETLDMFFPFDPYLLPNSVRFIRPNYIYWSMVKKTYDDEDEDENEDEVGDQSEVSIDDDKEHSHKDDGIALGLYDVDDSLNNPRKYRFGGELGRMQMPSKIRPSTRPPESSLQVKRSRMTG